MLYEFFIGFRYLKAKRRHAFISLISWISIGGVAVGVTALIVVLAVMSGFEIDLRDKMLGITSHIVVQRFGSEGILDYESAAATISKLKQVESAAPFIQSQVMIAAGKDGSAGVVIHGVDPNNEGGVLSLKKNLKEGNIFHLEAAGETNPENPKSFGIILGKELFKSLGSYIGQEVRLITPLGRMTPGGMMPKMKTFTVVGRFNSGMYEYDSSLAFISLKAAQKFFNMKNAVSGIEVKVSDIFMAELIANNIQEKLAFPYYTRSWMQMNKTLFLALKREKIIMFMILTLIILVAAFNIASTLIMVVMEKAKEIAVLKSMGATHRSILCIFSIEGLVIGIFGAFLGVAGGMGIVNNLGNIEQFLEKMLDTKVFPSDVYYLDKLPAHIEFFDIGLILSSTIIICLCATIYPAWKASRIDPVEILRYE